MYDRYELPMMVVENGLGAIDKIDVDGKIHDDYRTQYLKEHIEAMDRAIQNGVDLRGYTTWGCQREQVKCQNVTGSFMLIVMIKAMER